MGTGAFAGTMLSMSFPTATASASALPVRRLAPAMRPALDAARAAARRPAA